MNRPIVIFSATLLLISTLVACGDSGPSAGVEILEAAFTHELNEQMQPTDPGSGFSPGEPIHLSIKLAGRPKEGTVTADFYWGDTFIVQAGVSLDDQTNPAIAQLDESTYVGFTLNQDELFPISQAYRTEVAYNGRLLATYPFSITPPPEAIHSNVRAVTLALAIDENYGPVDETSVFGPSETVYLVGRGDMGLLSWLRAEWYVNGQLEEAGTRLITLEENVHDVGLYFSYVPEQGWPPGDHYVLLSLNDQEVGRYPFTIITIESAAPLEEEGFWDALPLPEDAVAAAGMEGIDVAFATGFAQSRVLDFYWAWMRQQGWERQPIPEESAPDNPYQIWRKEDALFFIEIKDPDEAGRTVVWMQFQKLE